MRGIGGRPDDDFIFAMTMSFVLGLRGPISGAQGEGCQAEKTEGARPRDLNKTVRESTVPSRTSMEAEQPTCLVEGNRGEASFRGGETLI